MKNNVRVAMAGEAKRMLDAHAPKNQRASLDKPMRIVAAADAHYSIPKAPSPA
jgi:hypothetical protein